MTKRRKRILLLWTHNLIKKNNILFFYQTPSQQPSNRLTLSTRHQVVNFAAKTRFGAGFCRAQPAPGANLTFDARPTSPTDWGCGLSNRGIQVNNQMAKRCLLSVFGCWPCQVGKKQQAFRTKNSLHNIESTLLGCSAIQLPDALFQGPLLAVCFCTGDEIGRICSAVQKNDASHGNTSVLVGGIFNSLVYNPLQLHRLYQLSVELSPTCTSIQTKSSALTIGFTSSTVHLLKASIFQFLLQLHQFRGGALSTRCFFQRGDSQYIFNLNRGDHRPIKLKSRGRSSIVSFCWEDNIRALLCTLTNLMAFTNVHNPHI